jgi:PIN domain nuclease of toxin-antitoxin system
MRVLLDTHALLWWLGADEQLSEAAYGAIETAENPLAAQALSERIPIVTRDPALGVYGAATIW